MSFERSLSIKDDMQAEINKEARALSLNILRLLIKQTPVGNPETWLYNHPERGYIDYIGYFGMPDYVGGRARSNWFTNAGLTRSNAITEDTKPDLSIATSKM